LFYSYLYYTPKKGTDIIFHDPFDKGYFLLCIAMFPERLSSMPEVTALKVLLFIKLFDSTYAMKLKASLSLAISHIAIGKVRRHSADWDPNTASTSISATSLGISWANHFFHCTMSGIVVFPRTRTETRTLPSELLVVVHEDD
jgi:hypothetical protein